VAEHILNHAVVDKAGRESGQDHLGAWAVVSLAG